MWFADEDEYWAYIDRLEERRRRPEDDEDWNPDDEINDSGQNENP